LDCGDELKERESSWTTHLLDLVDGAYLEYVPAARPRRADPSKARVLLHTSGRGLGYDDTSRHGVILRIVKNI
jgi:hypothetical protein